MNPEKKTEVARLLLFHGADPNAKTSRSRTPQFAAALDNFSQTKLLVDVYGASATTRDVDGFSPLHETQKAQIARFLLEHGADPNARDKWEHRTPLHFADNLNDEALRSVLIEFGGKR